MTELSCQFVTFSIHLVSILLNVGFTLYVALYFNVETVESIDEPPWFIVGTITIVLDSICFAENIIFMKNIF